MNPSYLPLMYSDCTECGEITPQTIKAFMAFTLVMLFLTLCCAIFEKMAYGKSIRYTLLDPLNSESILTFTIGSTAYCCVGIIVIGYLVEFVMSIY